MTARDLAPGPWRAGDYGAVEDGLGEVVLRLATRLNTCDDSWRELAAELAAAPDMRIALVGLLSMIDRLEPRLQQSDPYHAAVAALKKARGSLR